MTDETKKPKIPNPYSYENGIVTLQLYKHDESGPWCKKYGFFSYLGYQLGGFWATFGGYLRNLNKEGKPITKVVVKDPEKTTVVFIAWLVKVILGIQTEVVFENVHETKPKFLAGNLDTYLNFDKITEDINKMNITALRELTEILAGAHIVISDALYQIDFGTTLGDTEHSYDIEMEVKRETIHNRVTSWQSYGRYTLRNFREKVIKDFVPKYDECLLVPCTLSKPYYNDGRNISTSTDKSNLIKIEMAKGGRDVIVMTTIGVVPQEYWHDPVDLNYDVRVPDLYADMLSMKAFFTKNHYKKVYCWLNYGPYLEMVKICKLWGLMDEVIWCSDKTLSNRKGQLGAFFSIKQGDKKLEEKFEL